MFKVISHEVLVNCGWNSVLCLCCSGLCFIYYTSQSFIVAWFSVCLSLMSFYPLVNKLQNQNPKNLFYLVLFCDIVLACSLVVWEQFLGLTSLESFSGMKLNYIFPGISLFIWFWEVNKVRKYFRLHFFASDSTIKDSTTRRILLIEK